jgi:hypothetical protein
VPKESPYYLTINIKDFSITLYHTKKQLAEAVSCNPNTLKDMNDRITIDNYIIISVPLPDKPHREKKKDKEYGI